MLSVGFGDGKADDTEMLGDDDGVGVGFGEGAGKAVWDCVLFSKRFDHDLSSFFLIITATKYTSPNTITTPANAFSVLVALR